ncbi:MAG: MBL fold metallo-hydrolase [Paludibacteraceae bacterium]|nr:MBL fold metallo-hydrolase [Paludibacteraceae bacterium]
MKTKILTFLLLLSATTFLTAQTASENPYANNYIYWGYPTEYKAGQATAAFTVIDTMLQTYRPGKEIPLPRELALVSLDQLLHDTDNDGTDPFYAFINKRMLRVLEDLDRPVKKGLRIYKLYNDGFIIKSSKATVAIDMIPGGSDSKPFINDSIIFGIVGKCDALFISHFHPDHANLRVAKAFAANGKRVIAPKDLWVGVDSMIQPLAEHVETDIEFEDLDLTLHVLPGHQDNVYNNINVVEFHGVGTVAQTGDQWYCCDLDWIANVYKRYDIDVLMPNCWIHDMEEHIRGFAPKMLITGHENELGEHSIDHREAYWITMKKMEAMPNLNIPNVLMTWGEWYEYER